MVCETLDVPCLLEVGKVLPGFFTAGAAIYGAFIAKQGLSKWRAETSGERRIALAEEGLALAVEAMETIRLVKRGGRNAAKTLHPSATIDSLIEEAHDILTDKADVFSKLPVKQLSFEVYFDEEAGKPFLKIWQTYNRVLFTVQAAQIASQTGDKDMRGEYFDQIIGRPDDDDKPALDDALSALRATCRSVLDQDKKARSGWA